MSSVATARELLASLGEFGSHITGDDVAHLEVHGNEVVGSHLVPGLDVDVEQLDDGIEAHIQLQERSSPTQCTSVSACCPQTAYSTSSCRSTSTPARSPRSRRTALSPTPSISPTRWTQW